MILENVSSRQYLSLQALCLLPSSILNVKSQILFWSFSPHSLCSSLLLPTPPYPTHILENRCLGLTRVKQCPWEGTGEVYPKIVKIYCPCYIDTRELKVSKVTLFSPRLSVGPLFPSYYECQLKSHSCSCPCKLCRPLLTDPSRAHSHRPCSVTNWNGGVKALPKFNSVVLFMLQSSPWDQAEASLQ